MTPLFVVLKFKVVIPFLKHCNYVHIYIVNNHDKSSLLGGQVVPGIQPVFPIVLPMVHNTRVKSRAPFSHILNKGRRVLSREVDPVQCVIIHCPHPSMAVAEKNKHVTE